MSGNGRVRPKPRRAVWLIAVLLVVVGELVAWVGQPSAAVVRLGMAWALVPASDTVTIRLTSESGPSGQQMLAHSRLVVTWDGYVRKGAPDAGAVKIPVPPGSRTWLVVEVRGPQPLRRTLAITAPLLRAPVCHREAPLYTFASPVGRAIYLTVDDGWTPSPRVLAIMRRTHLPVTAFLIAHAAQQDVPYWQAFARAGGTIGDHTVSHPDLTKLTLAQDIAQWSQARLALGSRLGEVPLLGRPPYGALDHTVQVAACQAGLTSLVGWTVTVDRGRIQTWDGKPLGPGEIVLLHWVPGLDRELTLLLAAIHAQHLHPMPLTSASFTGVAAQHTWMGGD